jgi:single-strand DNA-binding protein
MLPSINGEFGVVADPELRFSEKGNSWIKIRGVSKDRVRDANGTWGDGDPLFIDIVTNTGADNLFESIVKGDTITVAGKLKQREYEKDGEKRVVYEIRADYVGVSIRWTTAKTPKAIDSTKSTAQVAAALGGEVIDHQQSELAPF